MSLHTSSDVEAMDWWRKPMLLGVSLMCVIGVHWWILQ
jgi:hypothetical protein